MRESATNRIPELDGIRGLAILCVVIWHYFVCQIVAIPGTPLAYAMKSLSLMWAGVDLFFVLSGFLIARVLLAVQDTPNYFWFVARFCG